MKEKKLKKKDQVLSNKISFSCVPFLIEVESKYLFTFISEVKSSNYKRGYLIDMSGNVRFDWISFHYSSESDSLSWSEYRT